MAEGSAGVVSGASFDALFRAAPVALIVSTQGGVVVEANPAAETLLGRTRSEIVGRTRAEIVGRDLVVTDSAVELAGVPHVVSTLSASDDERRVKAVVDASTSAILVVDARGIVRSANRASERVLGWRPSEIEGTSIEVLVPARSRGAHEAMRAAFNADPQARPMGTGRELLALRKDGREIQAEIALSPIAGEGEPLTLVVVSDITERKAIAARAMAADRLATIGTLAAGAAHEINNPLAALVANLELFATELDAERPSPRVREMQELVREAREGAQRIRSIVRGLYTFSRTTDDRPSVFTITHLLDRVTDLLAPEIRGRARLVKDYRPVPEVRGEEAKLGQALVNILLNAVQAIPPGQPSAMELRISVTPGEGATVVVAIADTGRGIAAEDLPRIFDPFFTTREIGDGTGLGLTIARNVVSSMGGALTVESEPGRGTIVGLELPAVTTESMPPPASERALPAVSRRGRVLVVDDDPAIGRSIRRLLRDEHDVTIAADGKAGLAEIESATEYDVVLCDLMMPEMTGMELYEKVHVSRPAMSDRFVFITAGAFTPEARTFLDAVPSPRLEKPFVPQNLRTLVRRYVR